MLVDGPGKVILQPRPATGVPANNSKRQREAILRKIGATAPALRHQRIQKGKENAPIRIFDSRGPDFGVNPSLGAGGRKLTAVTGPPGNGARRTASALPALNDGPP